MAGVNGVEIKVGQVWRTRSGEVVTVFVREHNDTSYPWCARNADGDEIWLTNSGRDYESLNRPNDLIELVKDENGFTIWRGGEQPPETAGKKVEYRYEDDAGECEPANGLRWTHTDSCDDIVAYKVVEQTAAPQPADNGTEFAEGKSSIDLIELVKDENGFTIWRGGEQPPETAGRFVTFATNEFEGWTREADLLHWAHNGARGDIVAYKVVEQAAAPQPADSATLAEETLSALGWTFDGQAWVENAVTEMPVGMLDNPVSAPALLTAAAKHMYDRAATYDKPEGERSMAQTVAVFEAYHGIKLTEAQGWHFMQVLKDVRLFTRDSYHADSAEDCIAYAALKAEAKAQEPTHG